MAFDTDYIIDMIAKQLDEYSSLKEFASDKLTPHQESFIDGARFVIEKVMENRRLNDGEAPKE